MPEFHHSTNEKILLAVKAFVMAVVIFLLLHWFTAGAKHIVDGPLMDEGLGTSTSTGTTR